MTKLAAIRKQIAALEATASRIAKHETEAGVARVRALMHSLGVTLEHLTSSPSKGAKKSTAASKKAAGKRAGAGVPKYSDPKTGATWTGFGRAPAWIAEAKNRDKFLIAKPSTAVVSELAPSIKVAAKKVARKASSLPMAPAQGAAAAKKKKGSGLRLATATRNAKSPLKGAKPAAKKRAQSTGVSAPVTDSSATAASTEK